MKTCLCSQPKIILKKIFIIKVLIFSIFQILFDWCRQMTFQRIAFFHKIYLFYFFFFSVISRVNNNVNCLVIANFWRRMKTLLCSLHLSINYNLTGGQLTEFHLTFSVDQKFLIIWAFDRILFWRLIKTFNNESFIFYHLTEFFETFQLIEILK